MAVLRDSSLKISKRMRDVASSVPSHCGIRERTQQREQPCERALLADAFANWNHADTTDASLRKVLRERRPAMRSIHSAASEPRRSRRLAPRIGQCSIAKSNA